MRVCGHTMCSGYIQAKRWSTEFTKMVISPPCAGYLCKQSDLPQRNSIAELLTSSTSSFAIQDEPKREGVPSTIKCLWFSSNYCFHFLSHAQILSVFKQKGHVESQSVVIGQGQWNVSCEFHSCVQYLSVQCGIIRKTGRGLPRSVEVSLNNFWNLH